MKSFIRTKEDTFTLSKSKNNEGDILCSSYINFENPKFAEIDGFYYASLLVVNYAREMEKVFLDKLMSLDVDIELSIQYEKLDSYSIIKELTYNIGNTGATIKTSSENRQDIDFIDSKYSDAKNIRKALQVGDEKLFYLSICVGSFAKDQKELEKNLERIESVCASIGLSTIRANYRQEDSLKFTLPFVNSIKSIEEITQRNVLTSGLVATYPFLSNRLFDKNGVLIGINSFDNSIIMLDRFDTNQYKNANMFIVGTSGSGKSYFTKLMISRNRFLNIRQFVIDPDREYEMLCSNLAGSIIKIGPQGSINMFDIRNTALEDEESYLKAKVAKLVSIISLMLGLGTKDEEASLEELIIKCYKDKGITEDNNSLFQENSKSILLGKRMFKNTNDMPVLKDLYELIKKDELLKKYSKILKVYISGSLSYFNNHTNINTDNKLVVVDVHDVSEDVLPVVMCIITDYFWDEIKRNRNEKKIIYFDEIWKLISKSEYSADFVFKLFKTIRKFGGAATAITQDISDFFMLEDGKYGKAILNNSSIKCMFQLEETDIKLLEDVIRISDEEKYRLVNMKRGTTLIHAGRNVLLADVISSKNEHNYITTDIV